jgi:P4 family phage/plasmid primase-like protien
MDLKVENKYKKDFKQLENKLDRTKKENVKLLTEIDKLRNSLSYHDFYKYDKYGEITGFYPKILSKVIESKFKLLTPNANRSNMLTYRDGVYVDSTNEVLQEIREYISIKDQSNNYHEDQTLETIARDTYIDSTMLNSDDTYINFKNCLLDVNNDFLVKNHNSKNLSTIQINCSYKPNLSSKIKNTYFWKYLNSSLSLEYTDLIQELFGYVLSNSMKGQKFIVLLGDGKNGKSVLLNILKSFYSNDLVSNVSIEDLQKKEFLAKLYNKKLNINGDIPDTFLENTDVLKKLTGQDTINAKALYENPFDFNNKAKIIFSCNKLPKSKDKTFGYYRRFCIIPFVNKISERDKITDLDEIIIKNELDIIASWAIEGLKRLIKNNYKFSETKQMEEVIVDYQNQNNSILQFMNELTVETDSNYDFIPVAELKKIYKCWCSVENKKALSDFDFTLKKSNYKMSTNIKVTSKRHWKCVKWNELVREYNIYNDDLEGVISKDNSIFTREELEASNINYLKEFNNMTEIQLENIIRLASNKLSDKRQVKNDVYSNLSVFVDSFNDDVLKNKLKYLKNNKIFEEKFKDFAYKIINEDYLKTKDYDSNAEILLNYLDDIEVM